MGMTNTSSFIHLRLHTEYSLLEGAVPVKKLPELCAAAGMPAVAVTDTNNMFGALEFSIEAVRQGVQPIIGCQLDMTYEESRSDGRHPRPAPIVILAQNEAGYRNLMKLNSCAYLDAGGMLPQISVEELCEHSEGVILLTGGPDGPLGKLVRMGKESNAAGILEQMEQGFGNRLYVELQRHPHDNAAPPEAERLTERWFVETAYDRGLPLVATNDVYFPAPDMHEAHDALICIAEGAYVDQQESRRRLTPQHCLKSPQEMAALFADLPEALENTVEIARRCSFKVATREPILPKFADDEAEELRRQAKDGLAARLASIELSASAEEYERRLEFELGVIEKMNFPGYFLIVADFIKWAKNQGIPVGPGRGSGAGSLVAYSLTITNLDPLRYGLLFERFLNPERVSMPDFDIDFCKDRREDVIEYVRQKYGKEKVAQIITFGALQAKMVVRDVGRVLQMPYGQVDRLAKMIPMEGANPVSIEKALADEPRLREEARNEEVVNRMLGYGQQIEGLLRNASTHAAGVVIGDRPLDELVPLYQDYRSEMPATQFNMKWVEQAGLVKYDLLGLKTLTVIQNAVDLLAERGVKLNIDEIPLDDPKTYELYSSAKTVAVFQVESSGMKDTLRRMKPTSIEDIIALVALYRPGPIDNIPEYCEVKNGLRERESIHPSIDPILDETQGIIVYQEQVMEIARQMAGYSLGGADMLRRAMGKKIKSAMDAERPKFLEGAKSNGIDGEKARKVWDLLYEFANYGFNKSHAAAYAVVSYQTAWLKANHPVEFMAGIMNCDLSLTEKLAEYAEEARRNLKIEILPPCVNRSAPRFSVADGKIIYGLGALKNVGVEAMRLITDARDGMHSNPSAPDAGAAEMANSGRGESNEGPFVNLADFARRVDMRRIGKRQLEVLAQAGVFDQLDSNRRRVLESIDQLVAYSTAAHEQKASKQVSLFGEAGDDLPEPRLSSVDDWLPNERLANEYDAVGFYLSDHPLDNYQGPLKRSGVSTFAELEDRAKSGPLVAKIAGAVSKRQEKKSARGNRFAFVQLSDPTGTYEVTVFSDTLEAARNLLESGQNVVLGVEAEMEGKQLKLLARSVTPVDTVAAEAGAMGIKAFVDETEAVASIAGLLEQAAQEAKSRVRGPVQLCLISRGLPGDVELELGDDFHVTPQIKSAIKSLGGVVAVEDI